MKKQIIDHRTQTLVTGGAGFIGSHLVEYLVKVGAKVTVVDNLSTGSIDNLQAVLSEVELIVEDIGELLSREQIKLADFQFIFHLAANPYIPPSVEDPAFDYHANLHNTFLLLEALRCTANAPRLVNASSAAVYGNPIHLPIKETDPTVPISPYGVSKLAGERYIAVYSQLYGLQATSLRFFSVYGPRQRKQVVYDLLQKLWANPDYLEVMGDGSQARDFTYVLDVIQAILLAATASAGQGEVYNVASGNTYNISQLVTTLCQVCGLAPDIQYTGQIRPGDAERWEVDITPLKRLNFEVRVPLKVGLTAVRNWYEASNQ